MMMHNKPIKGRLSISSSGVFFLNLNPVHAINVNDNDVGYIFLMHAFPSPSSHRVHDKDVATNRFYNGVII